MVEGRRTPVKRIPEGLFFFGFQKNRLLDFAQSSFNVFGVFEDGRGRGDPCKTYS